MFGNGVSIIESALGQFNKVREKLKEGIAAVDTKIGENAKHIESIALENNSLQDAKKRAEKAYDGITRLLEGN